MDTLALRRCLWAIILMIGANFGMPAHAGNVNSNGVGDLSVLVDPQGKDTIETVSRPARAHDFKPAPYGFSAGYTRKVHWLRFKLFAPPPQADGRRLLYVEFYPPYLDDLQVFTPRPDGKGFDRQVHGDQKAFSERAIHHRAFVQSVDFPSDRPMTVYVRLQTTSSSVVGIKALTPGQFLDHTTTEYALLGLFFGLLLAGLLANIKHAFGGDPLRRAFLIHLTTALYMLFGVNGLFAEYLFRDSPLWADRSTSIGAMLIVASATYFYGKVLDMERAAPWMRAIYRVVLWLGILFLPSPFLGYYPETERILILGATLVVLVGMWRAIELYRQKTWGSLHILLALACSLLGASATTLTLLGLLPGQFWLINSYTISTLGTLAALQAYFILRARLTEAGLAEARLEAGRAAAVLETERASKEAQSRFLAMLTHELKTPLSALRLCLGQIAKPGSLRKHAENAVEQIDSIIDRCDLACRYDDGRLEVTKQPCCLHELLADLAAKRAESGRIVLDVPREPPVVLVTDPVLLKTILDNLAGNALKYSPAQALINLSASLHARDGRDGVRIRVENPVSGPAMRPDPARVFTKYYRAPQAQRSTGSGLGLYIARGLSTMLGGDTRYFPDQPNVVFEVWIPA